MGLFFSKKKDSVGFAKQLSEIEDKISVIEDRLLLSRDFQKRLLKRILLFSTIVELVIIGYTYYRFRTLHNIYTKLTYAIFSILFPLFIYLLTKLFNFFYGKLIKKNENKLESLKQSLQEKLDERIRDTDFEATQKLVARYQKTKKESPTKGNKNSNNSNNSNSNNFKPLSPPKINNPQNNSNNNSNILTQRTTNVPNHNVNQSPSKVNRPQQLPQQQLIQQPQQPIQQQPPPFQLQQPPKQSWWLDKLVEYIISDGPKYGSPLICSFCHSHNGYVPSEELSNIQFRCRFCQEFNQKGETAPSHNNKANKNKEIDDIDFDTEIRATSSTTKQIDKINLTKQPSQSLLKETSKNK